MTVETQNFIAFTLVPVLGSWIMYLIMKKLL